MLRRDAGATTSKYAADGVGNADSLKRSKYYKNKKIAWRKRWRRKNNVAKKSEWWQGQKRRMNVKEDLQRKIMDHELRRRRTVSGAKVKQCRVEWMESYWEAGWNLKECARWAKLVLEGSIKVSKKQAVHYYGIAGIVKKLAELRQAGGEDERMEGKWCRVISSAWIREWRRKEELSRQGSMKMLMQEGEVVVQEGEKEPKREANKYKVGVVVHIQSWIRRWLAKVCAKKMKQQEEEGRVLLQQSAELDWSCYDGEVEGARVATLTAEQEEYATVLNIGSAGYEEFRVACTFVEFETEGRQELRQVLTGFDTMSMVNIMEKSQVDPSWKWLSRGGRVKGIGGQLHSIEGIVEVPAHAMTYLGERKKMIVSVIKQIPHGVHLLIGLPTILSPEYSIKPDPINWRVHINGLKEVVRLDWITSVKMRMAAGPQVMLSLCAGILVEVPVAMEMGWNVVEVLVMECGINQRRVIKALFGDLVMFIGDDVRAGVKDEMLQRVTMGHGGPTCTPWSGLRDSPGGCEEEEAQVFKAVATIFKRLRQLTDGAAHVLLETVVVHRDLKDDMAIQEEWCGGEINRLCAADVGGAAGRDRRYYSPTCDWELLYYTACEHMNPDWAANLGGKFAHFKVPCVVCSHPTTKSPVMVMQRGFPKLRFAVPDEFDRLQGLKAGTSCGGYRVDLEDSERFRLSGGAFSADAIWAISRTWKVKEQRVAVLSVAKMLDFRHLNAKGQMEVYMKWYKNDKEGLAKYFQNLAINLEMPKLDLLSMMADQETARYQTRAPGYTKTGLGPSCDYCIDCAIRDGSHQDVEWSREYWIVLLFFQKKGRKIIAEFDGITYKKGDELEAMRPLRNYTSLNSAIANGIPKWWREFCPVAEDIRSQMPVGCVGMATYDAKNAFHSVRITDDSRSLCVSKYVRGDGVTRYIQAKGGDQGVSAMALFFPVWIAFGYNFFFGQAWYEEPWWSDFVDDSLLYSMMESGYDAEVKMFCMGVTKRCMGLEVSMKIDLSVRKEVEFVGLWWTISGLTIGEQGVKDILGILDKQPAGIKQARMLRGVVVQARSAFVFTAGELLKFSALLAVITSCIDLCNQSGKKLVWTKEAEESVDELKVRLKDQPRAYTNPEMLMNEEYCLCIRGDADPDAIMTSLWLVKRRDANDVCCADFEEEGRAILLGIRPKSLGKSSRRWHISEKELFSMVYGVRMYGALITECVAKWALKQDQSEWYFSCGQLVPHIAKVCFASDSSSALGMLIALHLPSGKLEHLTPKIERCTGYAEETACTMHWPIARLQMPGAGDGPCNSICDYICRMVGELKRMKGVPTFEDEEVEDPAFRAEDVDWGGEAVLLTLGEPMAESGDKQMEGVPEGMAIQVFTMNVSEWKEVERAFSVDCGEYSSVRMCDIYLRMNGRFEGSSETGEKIDSWLGKLFYPVKINDEMGWLPFTVVSAVRPVDGSEKDFTKELVMVVPAGAMVNVSGMEVDTGEETISGPGGNDLRHDILWWAHYAKVPHARLHESLERAASVSWWSEQNAQVKYMYRYCSVCCQFRLALSVAGFGLSVQAPFQVVQMDDAKLSKKLAARVPYMSVMVFVCVGSGACVYVLRNVMSAAEAAFLFVTTWIKENGFCQLLCSDNDAGFCSEMMAIICRMFGMKDQQFSGRGSHCNFVERAVSIVRKVLFQMEVLGDVVTDRDVQLAVAYAQIEANQVNVTDGSTVFERTRGYRASTAKDLLAVKGMSDGELCRAVKKLTKVDGEMVTAMKDRCDALMGEHKIQQEKRARYNYGYRVSKEGKKTNAENYMTMEEGLELGSKVSYQGNKYFMLDEKATNEQGKPVEVFLRSCLDETDEKWVVFSEVRPLAVSEQMLVLPRSDFPAYNVHDVVAYSCAEEPEVVQLGVVMESADDGISVHELWGRQCKTKVTFLPKWNDGETDQRHTACPEGCEAVIDQIEMRYVLATVTLDKANGLSHESLNLLEAMGLEVDLKAHGK